jgi:hypothetical protein
MKLLLAMLVLGMITGCNRKPIHSDSVARTIAQLVDETTKAQREQNAFAQLENMGPEAVPYIVSYLDDSRPLPEKSLTLANHSPAFEAQRHYTPQVVHDALAAILNQITGQSFESVYNGSTPEQRKLNTARWQLWCKKNYPAQAGTCSA